MYGNVALRDVKRTDNNEMLILHAVGMRMLRWMYRVTRKDKVRNRYLQRRSNVVPVIEKLNVETYQ